MFREETTDKIEGYPMKKIILLLISLVLTVTAHAACSESELERLTAVKTGIENELDNFFAVAEKLSDNDPGLLRISSEISAKMEEQEVARDRWRACLVEHYQGDENDEAINDTERSDPTK